MDGLLGSRPGRRLARSIRNAAGHGVAQRRVALLLQHWRQRFPQPQAQPPVSVGQFHISVSARGLIPGFLAFRIIDLDHELDYVFGMVVVNVSEAKARLTELLQRAESGERVLIARRNEPIVELRLIASRPSVEPRPFGLCAGELQVPDDFDEPLPEDILRAFEG